MTGLRIGLLGTRGIPATYGGFETAVEEIGQRLVTQGHEVTVFCREAGPDTLLGMRRVVLPALRRKTLETLSHSLLSAFWVLRRRRQFDVVIVFNGANSPVVPFLRLAGIPVAIHVDGLEWKRQKWSGAGRTYYRFAERFSVLVGNELIADARGIQVYYEQKFRKDTRYIAYGAPILTSCDDAPLSKWGLRPGAFNVVVARMEPENNVHLMVEGYVNSRAPEPLVVVGGSPYSTEYTRRIAELASRDHRILLLGPVYDQDALNSLYFHAKTCLHGHSVGGTNPSLLRAMGAGTPVIAFDVVFNREVLGETGIFVSTPEELAEELDSLDSEMLSTLGQLTRRRARELYDWNDVTAQYAQMCLELATGVKSITADEPLSRREPGVASQRVA